MLGNRDQRILPCRSLFAVGGIPPIRNTLTLTPDTFDNASIKRSVDGWTLKLVWAPKNNQSNKVVANFSLSSYDR